MALCVDFFSLSVDFCVVDRSGPLGGTPFLRSTTSLTAPTHESERLRHDRPGTVRGSRLAPRQVLRPQQQLHRCHLDDRLRGDADHRAAAAEGHQGHARDAAPAARAAQAAARAPRRPAEAERRDDEALPGAQGQSPGIVLPPAAAVPGVHHHVPGAPRSHRQDPGPAGLPPASRPSSFSVVVVDVPVAGRPERDVGVGARSRQAPDRGHQRVVRQGPASMPCW